MQMERHLAVQVLQWNNVCLQQCGWFLQMHVGSVFLFSRSFCDMCVSSLLTRILYQHPHVMESCKLQTGTIFHRHPTNSVRLLMRQLHLYCQAECFSGSV